ncbi:hypothetical protein BDZ89DRAFT_1075342 [Hymenopellis radicata]|nr:hypothetical protein BDZ89DRAFT_1075339 [Hymenopellis radicata]KAF9016743.1 hypothetical protein BDZ89DRAFT_1075342 [Hymenopellis radicata]
MTMFSAFVRTALVLVLVAQTAHAYQCRCLSPEGNTANAVSESCCTRTGGQWLGTDCNVGPSFTAFSNCCEDPNEGRQNYHDECFNLPL